MRTWSQINLQDAVSGPIEEFIFFHDFTNIILLFILGFVGRLLYTIFNNKIIHKSLVQGHLLECIWTVLPAIILIQVALPSLVLLYTLEESIFSDETRVNLKVTGHQWYWNYSYPDLIFNANNIIQYDSYITPSNQLNLGEFRLLEVDNRVILPSLLPIRVLITRADVLHAWTIPRLGVKADAVPGRLNQLNIQTNMEGVFYGQCSEICGANHRFIPIVVEFIPFGEWKIVILNSISG